MTGKKTNAFWISSILMLALALGAGMFLNVTPALAEGSVQPGLNQPLDINGATNNTIYVDIQTSGEVINVSLNEGSFSIYDPTGVQRVSNQAGGQVSASDPFNAPITTAYKYTTDMDGAWRVVLAILAGEYERFDITVTPTDAINPDPRDAGGRVYAYMWSFYTHSFAESLSTDANYYILVPGGRPETDYVWQLDLNNFSGNQYDLIANDLGVNPPYSGYSISRTLTSWTPKFPMYLNYPAKANQAPLTPPVISNLRFLDEDGMDISISPDDTLGIQDSGTFSFTTDVIGTYAIVIDTNQNGQFAEGDLLLLGTVLPGENGVVWDGKGPGGATLPNGIYNARVQVRMGEYHFLAADAETSGGPIEDGLTICNAHSQTGILTDTLVYWDDFTFLGGSTTLPGGELCSVSAGHHTWGDFTGSGFGDERYIDTYVYGLNSYAQTEAMIGNDDPLYGPALDLDSDDSGGVSGNDYQVFFVDGSGSIAIADTDTVITDTDSLTLTQAEITLTGWQAGDVLTVTGTLSGGITVDPASTNLQLILTGVASLADYETAIEMVRFNTGTPPAPTPRTVTTRVKDDLINSPAAITTVYMDSDGDGVPDHIECPVPGSCVDTDGDDAPDYLDPDDDDDGIPTADEDVDGDGDPTNDDTDGDGTPNYLDDDDDNDGIPTADEDANGDNDPTNDDADNDSVPDYLEPNDVDTDGDGSNNNLDPDDDGDSVPTAIEIIYGTDPLDPTDPWGDDPDELTDPFADDDGDGVTNAWERILGTDPLDPDSDSSNTAPDENDNGISDAQEDFDGDGIPNIIEITYGTDPLNPNDPWGDDPGETTDPTADDDGDGVSNAWERILGTDPNDPDSDSSNTAPDENDNGLSDAEEDFDGDGISNATEIDAGTDPLDPTDNDTLAERVQTLVDASDDPADGAPIAQDLINTGLVNVIPGSMAAYEVGFTDPTALGLPPFSAPPTQAELQAVIDAVNQMTDSDGDGICDATELDAGTDPFDGTDNDTVAEKVQTLVDASDNPADGAPTAQDLINTELVNVIPGNMPAYEVGFTDPTALGLPPFSAPPTQAELQAVIDAVNQMTDSDGDGICDATELDAGTDPFDGTDNDTVAEKVQTLVDASADPADGAPTAQDLINTGLVNVIPGNMAAYEVGFTDPTALGLPPFSAPPTQAELQAVIDAVNAIGTGYTLTVNIAGSGVGTVTRVPSDTLYTSDTVVTLTAAAATSSTFTGWSGDLSGRQTPVTITMNADQTVTATFMTDFDGDGIPDVDEDINDDGDPTNDDTDGDGIPDYQDPDDDGDGIPTVDEDPDGDGDPTNDDTDGDGIPNYLDDDDDGDGVPTENEDPDGDGDPTNDDTDEDSIPNYLDPDDDGDGVPTEDEDTNGDGDPTNDDTDGDSIPNYLDDDDDGDGAPTADEDTNSDGDPTNDDDDGDGIPNYLEPDDQDTDGDGAMNQNDPDDDGDGIPTADEDPNDDGNPLNDDTDGDGLPNYLDDNDDGDSVATEDEDYDGNGDPSDDDTDEDGIPDYLDPDAPRTDLVLTMEAKQTYFTLVYTITVHNMGNLTATNAVVSDTFSALYESPTWTCTGTGGATCTSSSSGNISDTVTMQGGSTLVYVVTGAAGRRFLNVAEVIPPKTLNDMVMSNNRAEAYNLNTILLPLIYRDYTP